MKLKIKNMLCIIFVSLCFLVLSIRTAPATLIDLGNGVTKDDKDTLTSFDDQYWIRDLNRFVGMTYDEQITAINNLDSQGLSGISSWHMATYSDILSLWSFYDYDVGTTGSAFEPTEIQPTYLRWQGRYDRELFSTNPNETYHYQFILNYDPVNDINLGSGYNGATGDSEVHTGAYATAYAHILFLTVISPNGGEDLPAGTTHEITWTSEGAIENVKIEYSVNNGTDWIEITANTENDGSYDWEVPNNLSDECLVRISNVDGEPFDESDAVFSILPLWYVDGDIAVSGNGNSWTEAFKTIQEAIDAAEDGDVIWVKQGTYFVSSTINVDKSVAIYGGFDGTETQMSERNWRSNVTTVDGQNAVRCFKFTADATIDGFTIAHGQTSYGGGMFINSSSPLVTNCTFLENTAGSYGGGAIHSWNASPTITNSLFLENDGGSNGGGAIFNWDCPAVIITNCTFSKNNGGSRGGGAIYNYISSATVTNSILWNDSADTGSEVYNDGGTLTIGHCDIAGDVSGIVNAGGGTINDDGTNIEVDPLFGIAYHLKANSDCVDAGTNSAPELPSIDMDGESRIQGMNCDIGADEFHDTDGDGMPDWWEAIHGLDYPDDDDDRDGLSNLAEYVIGTYPNDPDSDNDGAGDGAEAGLGTDPADPSQTPECPMSYYVSPAGNDSNSCLFSGTPCKTIQRAIDVAYGTEICPVTIHVAAGTYNEHLVMDSWESLEGGWNSDFSQQWDFENDGLEPDPEYATIIDGEEIATCLTLNNIEAVTVDGFTIQNGFGEYTYDDHQFVGGGASCLNSSVHFKHTTFLDNTAEVGMGLYNLSSSVVISKCVFRNNYNWADFFAVSVDGGVIYHVGGTLSIRNSDFIGNWAEYSNHGIMNYSNWSEFVGCKFRGNGGDETGPVLMNSGSSPLIINCIFEDNYNFERGAGAIENYYSNPQIINSIFVRNRSYFNAGAISNYESSPEIINCTFVDNSSAFMDGFGSIDNWYHSSPTITNSILWNFRNSYELFISNDASSTATVTFSNIDQDGYEGQNGNIRQDPMFYDTGRDDNGTPDDPSDDISVGGADYHLQQDSSCIDAGDNSALPADTTDLDKDGDTTEPIPLDLDGNPRIIDGIVDMGAYEYSVKVAAAGSALRPWAENHSYWSYQGNPVLLLGGSNDDNLFQWPRNELLAQLDRLANVGGNVIRNTMSDRKDKGFEVYPFQQQKNGMYDLSQWNEEYWKRFERLLRETAKRGIVVQIEIWDRFDYTDSGERGRWQPHPYNPKNNVNYTYEQSGFAERYPDHPGANKQPFFFTTPEQRNNRVVLQYQQRYVDKMLDHALRYDHVLYCMDNETRADEEWGRYWAEYVKRRARKEGRPVFVTEMWDDHALTAERHKRTFDHPELYDFVDVSQNNHNSGQKHWDNFLYVKKYLSKNPRPINTTKTYGADGYRYGTDQDGVERFWRHLLAGAASIRFHRPESGLGLNEKAAASIRAARKLESIIPLWSVEPANELLSDREKNEAYLAADPGRSYVLYFPTGGEVQVDMSIEKESLIAHWFDIDSGEMGPTQNFRGGDKISVAAPGRKNWAVAIIVRK